jgi:hypothetical protein
MKMILQIPIVILLSSTTWALSIKGTVLERGTKVPLKDVSVFILPHKVKAQTDAKGIFQVDDVPPGAFQFVINLPGYQKLEIEDEQIGEDDNTPRLLFVERESYSAFETVIVGIKKKKDSSTKSLTQAEFLTLPGANGDPVKAVQNLPGVNRVSGFSSQVVIQGSAAKDTKYNIDGHEIPLVFHFGGLSSVVMPEALETVDYLSAGYESHYSRALGGIISLQTRAPDPGERDSKGFFFVDTLKAGGLYEKRIDEDSSYLISARHSYVGFLLGKIAEKREDFNLTVVPEFTDFTAIYHRKLSGTENLKVVALASRDSLGFLLKEPFKDDPAFRGTFKNETIFYRLIPQWRKDLGSDGSVAASIGLGQDSILFDVGSQYFRLKSNVLSLRGNWDKKWFEGEDFGWSTELGLDSTLANGKVEVKIPSSRDDGGVQDPFSSGTPRQQDVKFTNQDLGVYLRNEITTGRLTSLPSLRADSFGRTQEKLLSPRLGFRYQASNDLMLKTAGGIYYQPPEGVETDEVYGNPDIESPKALHFTLGFENDFREGRKDGYTWSTSYFDRWFEKLVANSSSQITRNGELVYENYNNTGAGRAYGIETQLKFYETPYTGWLSYTWSRSTRWNPNQPEYLSESDQTHNINLIASRDFPRNWKISGRFRYVTGNPYTPIVGGTFDADNDVYVPTRGAFYSERFSDFKQLDIRFDKKFIMEKEIWTFYLDIQNVWNQKNPENNQYAYDYSRKEEISGLPILPSLGLKGEF